jgi:hypothetical protein
MYPSGDAPGTQNRWMHPDRTKRDGTKNTVSAISFVLKMVRLGPAWFRLRLS